MIDRYPSRSAYLKTEPSPAVCSHHLTVDVKLREEPGYTLQPWIRITANKETETITLAAGIKARRSASEDDGA